MPATIARDKTKKETVSLIGLLKMFDMGQLRDDHPEQRHPSRWNAAIRDGFIATLIKGEDVDSIKICEQVRRERGCVDLWLIDGLQRLSNARMFKEGAFKIGKSIELPFVLYQSARKDDKGNFVKDEEGSIVYDTIEYDLRGKSYNDLPEELKNKFNEYNIDMVKHIDCTDEEVGYHIRRYNAKVNMNGNEKAMTYLDTKAGKVRDVASHAFFRDCTSYKEGDRTNGTIERSVMETLMFTFFENNWTKIAKDQGRYLNENCTDKEFNELNGLLNELENVLEDRHCKLFNSKNTLVFVKLFKEFKKLGLDNKLFDEFLSEFENNLCKLDVVLPEKQKLSKIETVEECSFIKLDGAKSSKDKGYLAAKMAILTYLMNEYFEVKSDDANENCKEDMEIVGQNEFDFVKTTVNPDVTDEDIDFYNDMLDELTLNVDNNSKLLNEENKNSLIGIIAYSIKKDLDLDNWFVDYFKRNKLYKRNQVDNYFFMVDDLNRYMKGVA